MLASQVVFGLNSLSKLEGVTTQTNAALKSTGAVSGQTAEGIRTMSTALENLNATIDDTVIQAGANLLLTFTNIRGKAFEPTLQAALDMNQALGGGPDGLAGVVTILGKALNDPLKGLTALGRKGVTFTADQKAQIAAAVKAGDTYKAQGVILAELQKRYAGSFLAGGQTTTGKIAGFTDAIDDLQRALATALLPAIGKVATSLKTFLANPAVIRGISDLGTKIASLFSDANLTTGANVLKGLFTTIQSSMPVIESAAGTLGNVIGVAVAAFRSLPPELQALAVAGFAINKLTGGLVTNIAGGLISAVISSFKGLMNVNAAVVNVNGPVAGRACRPEHRAQRPSGHRAARRLVSLVSESRQQPQRSSSRQGPLRWSSVLLRALSIRRGLAQPRDRPLVGLRQHVPAVSPTETMRVSRLLSVSRLPTPPNSPDRLKRRRSNSAWPGRLSVPTRRSLTGWQSLPSEVLPGRALVHLSEVCPSAWVHLRPEGRTVHVARPPAEVPRRQPEGLQGRSGRGRAHGPLSDGQEPALHERQEPEDGHQGVAA